MRNWEELNWVDQNEKAVIISKQACVFRPKIIRIFSQNFLRDLLKEAKKINDVSEDKLIEYTDTMVSYIPYSVSANLIRLTSQCPLQLQVFDSNKDGRLQLSEMAK